MDEEGRGAWHEIVRDVLKRHQVTLVTYVPDNVLRPLIDAVARHRILQLRIRELFACGDDMKTRPDRLFDLRQDGVQPRSRAEHHDILLLAGRRGTRVEIFRGRVHGAGSRRAGNRQQVRQFLARKFLGRIGRPQKLHSPSSGECLSDLEPDRSQTDQRDPRAKRSLTHRSKELLARFGDSSRISSSV